VRLKVTDLAGRFLSTHLEQCSTFHAKIFAAPIPPQLLPKMTKSKTSKSESSTTTLAPQDSRAHSVRSISRPPSDAGSRTSVPPDNDMPRRRSFSRSESTLQAPNANGNGTSSKRRSRSRSIDPPRESLADLTAKPRPLVRAPSGKDLFKGREVQLMRRTSSMARKDSQRRLQESLSTSTGHNQNEIQKNRAGLLGRKTSDQNQNQNQNQVRRRLSNDGE
jgi:hypothetical protein